jgi:AAA15 family ATPase/GTPase
MIVSVHFKNFKALDDFIIHLRDCNILTGPNNNGKSTILDGFRVLQGAYRYASRYNPELLLDLPFNMPDSWGYKIPLASIPITLENIQTNFNTEEPSLIKYKFKQGQSLTLCFHPEHL